MRGTLYGIGVGPGEPELITLKALNRIKKSNYMILPAEPKEECFAYRAVSQIYPEIEEKELICLPFIMTKDKKKLRQSHQTIYETVSSLLERGEDAAFLTIGDPSVYSTYSYIHNLEKEKGWNPVIISGVPSFCAAAAALGISLTENREQLHIIPGSFEIADTLKLKGTKIYMKSGINLIDLKELLLREENRNRYFVYGITNCGLPDEHLTYRAEDIDVSSGYLTIIIVKELKW